MSKWNPEANEIFAEIANVSDVAERRRLLDNKCGTNDALRRAVESLLGAYDEDPKFLEKALVNAELEPTSNGIQEAIGSQIGPYKLLQEIGEGGFGTVYMADQKKPVRRKVALKVIKAGMDTREVIARFEAERQALAMMDHPNIAKVLDAGTTDSARPYFVMELVRGVAITEFCDKNRLGTRERLAMFANVCQAVQHAHHKGIIHRDLKPSNVMVTLNDGQPLVKVIDFGVAKAINQELTEKTLFTSYGQMVGTPQYMSPEQAEMSAMDIDTRSDVYSLGVLLYELLTGTTPLNLKELRAAGLVEIQKLITNEEAPRPSARLSTLGDELSIVATNRKADPTSLQKLVRGEIDWIVMTALDKDRNRRYETASAIAADIQRYLSNEAVEACPPSVGYRLRKYMRRNRVALVTGAVIAISLIGGLIATSWMAVEAERQKQLATQKAVEANEQKEFAIQALDRVQEELRWKATTLAMSGMSQQLENVIREVEITSAPNKGWAQRVRAIAASADEDPQATIDLLHDAIKLGDKTVAAYSLLVNTYWHIGNLPPSRPYLKLARSMEPQTPEDELYLAGINFVKDPKRAFELADKVYKQHPSPAVLDIRARACEHLGLVTRDPTWLERGIRDSRAAAYAKGQSPAFSIYCHAWAIELAKDRGDQANVDYHTVVGKRLISEIGNISSGVPYFHIACEDFEQAEEAYRSLELKGDHFKRLHAFFLLSRGDDAGVMKVVNAMDAPSDYISTNVYRAAVLAESPTTRAESRELLLQDPKHLDAEFQMERIGWLHGLGFRDDGIREARRISELLRKENSAVPAALDFLSYVIDEESFMASAGENHKAKANVYGIIVWRHLGAGNVAAAKQMLADWDGLHLGSFTYQLLMRMRNMIERDPNWPHWIATSDESRRTSPR